MKAIIAGGGTGGHLFPGITVARELLRRYPDAGILFVGAEQGIEKRIVPTEGFELETLPIGGLKRVNWTRRMRNLVAIVVAVFSSMRILARFEPDVVVGVGGYASFPMVGAAIIKGLPRVIMEQNVLPGLANRVLGRGVDFAAVADERAARYFPRHAVVTGNPIRSEFKTIGPKEHRPPYTVLIFGGSQGAQSINLALIEALEILSGWRDRLMFVHQAGAGQLAEVRSAYQAAGFKARVQDFFDQFDQEYAAADLIISRAGATTVEEIKASGRAAILIPLPFAADDHQRRNARAMVEESAAVMIDENDLNGSRIAGEIVRLFEDLDGLRQMETNARNLAILDAESRIVDLIESAIEKRRR